MHPHSRHKFFLLPLAILGFLALFSFAVFALWNGIVTDLFGLKAITYGQALGLLVLCKILFGGFPGRDHGPSWRDKMRWSRHGEPCTPEQRERFRQEMRRRFGDWPHPHWGGPDTPPASDAPQKPAA